MKELDAFNRMVRSWADKQPARYRLSALAFGYPCNRKTHCFDQTLKWVSERSRKREGEGVSRATLVRHLPVFVAYGVIEVERRRDNDKNMSSVYHVDFSKVIEPEAEDMGRRERQRRRAERQAWLASMDVEPPEDDKPPLAHEGYDLAKCPGCQATPGPDHDKLETHLANGGKDPWEEPIP